MQKVQAKTNRDNAKEYGGLKMDEAKRLKELGKRTAS
jgi:hypothetical protein